MVVYINGQFVPQTEATISLEDRGFRFGDGIFETIRISNTIPYQWDEHFARLKKGLNTIFMDIPASRLEVLKSHAMQLIEMNQANAGFLRLAITRGSGSQGYLPLENNFPTIVMETLPVRLAPSSPVILSIASLRQPPVTTFPVQHKTMQGLHSTLVRMEAVGQEAWDGVILNLNHQICETSSGNIFWYKRGHLYTPAATLELIPGIIRNRLIALSPWPIKEGVFTLKELEDAEEVMLTNVAWLVLPVARILGMEPLWTKRDVSGALYQVIQADIKGECGDDAVSA